MTMRHASLDQLMSDHLAALRHKLDKWTSNPASLNIVAEEVFALRALVSKKSDDIFDAVYTERAAISVCWLLVLLTGMGMFELGSVRNKNVRQILNKHFLQAMFAVLCFFLVGYKIAFGSLGDYQSPGVHSASKSVSKQGHLLYHMLFTILVTSISSMPLAERGLLKASIGLTCVLATVTVPLAMSLVWNPQGLMSVHHTPPMFGTGFVDYAGGGVLHLVSGAASLVAAFAVGPRLDEKGLPRFSALANPLDFQGTSPIFTCLGYLWMWSSWFGFLHGGSLLPGQVLSSASCAIAAANVTITSAFGTMSYVIEYFLHHHRQFNFQRFFNRGLAALVAVNGFSGLVDPKLAPVVGFASGALYVQVSNLMIFLEIDDPVDTAAVQIAGGVTGLLAVALFADGGQLLSLYGTDFSGVLVDESVSSWRLLAAQLVGIWVMLLLSALSAGIYFGFLHGLFYFGIVADSLMRASRLNELQGLDMGLSGGHFFPPEVWKLIEEVEALNRVTPGVKTAMSSTLLDWPDPVRHMCFGSVQNGVPVDGRRSSLPEQIITDVKGSSRLRDVRRSFSGVRAQFRRRTQQPLEISSHGNDYLASFSGANNNEHSVTSSISTDHSTCVHSEPDLSAGRSDSSSIWNTGTDNSRPLQRRSRYMPPVRIVRDPKAAPVVDGVLTSLPGRWSRLVIKKARAGLLPRRLQRCHSAPTLLQNELHSLRPAEKGESAIRASIVAKDGAGSMLHTSPTYQTHNDPSAGLGALSTSLSSLCWTMCDSCGSRTAQGNHPRSSNNRPVIRFAVEEQVLKGEDFFNIVPKRRLLRSQARLPDGTWTTKEPDGFFGFFAVMDGHNGRECGDAAEDLLLDDIMNSMEPCLNDAQWEEMLPKAISDGYCLRNRQFVDTGMVSGCTATTLFLNGWDITCGNVGDSSCYVDSGNQIVRLSADHRLSCNDDEVQRLKASGQALRRLWHPVLQKHVGPLRAWPGGLAMSRTIGDVDVGPEILSIPEVFRLRLSPQTGGRIVLASDGLWDGLADIEQAISSVRVVDAKSAAAGLVDMSLKARGLRDDVTVIVVDVLPRAVSLSGFRRGFASTMGCLARNSALRQCAAPVRNTKEVVFGLPAGEFGISSTDEIAELIVERCNTELDD